MHGLAGTAPRVLDGRAAQRQVGRAVLRQRDAAPERQDARHLRPLGRRDAVLRRHRDLHRPAPEDVNRDVRGDGGPDGHARPA